MSLAYFAYFALSISPTPVFANGGNFSAEPLFSICQEDHNKSCMTKGFVNKKSLPPQVLRIIILENKDSG